MPVDHTPNKIVAIGSNSSDDVTFSKPLVEESIELLADRGIGIIVRSRFYQTPAFPQGAGPDFVNAAVAISTRLPPDQVLAILHQIEAQMGRRRTRRWGQRVIDLDLICWGDQILPDRAELDRWIKLDMASQQVDAPKELILPHPRVQDRSFVLIPMMDIAPNWRHPHLGLTTAELLAQQTDAEKNAVKVIQTLS